LCIHNKVPSRFKKAYSSSIKIKLGSKIVDAHTLVIGSIDKCEKVIFISSGPSSVVISSQTFVNRGQIINQYNDAWTIS